MGLSQLFDLPFSLFLLTRNVANFFLIILDLLDLDVGGQLFGSACEEFAFDLFLHEAMITFDLL
jgi:hypothetical protein